MLRAMPSKGVQARAMPVQPRAIHNPFKGGRRAGHMFSSAPSISISSTRQVTTPTRLVVCAGGRSLGQTCEGSNSLCGCPGSRMYGKSCCVELTLSVPCRHSKRTSGFRTRMRTFKGRKIIKARRKKGRHVLCTSSLRKNGKTRV